MGWWTWQYRFMWGGEHLANVFAGQFFFQHPDEDFFRKQAQKYGFNPEEYINDLRKVPVFDEDYINKGIKFLVELAEIIGEMGLKEKLLLETNEQLEKSHKELLKVITSMPIPMGIINSQNGTIELLNDKFTEFTGYSLNEVPDMKTWWKKAFSDEIIREKTRNDWIHRRKNVEITNDDIVPMESEITSKTGLKRVVRFYLRPMENFDIVSLVDLTEIRKAEEKERQYYQELHTINETFIQLLGVQSDVEIFKIIGKSVKNLLPSSMVTISSLVSDKRHMKIVDVLGLEKFTDALEKFKIDPFALTFSLSELDSKLLFLHQEGKLVRSEEGIYGVVMGKIPRKVCELIERFVNIGEVYSIAFLCEKKLYGGLVIQIPQGETLHHKEAIETIVHQASIAIQRIRAEEDLIKSEDKYRAFINSTSDMAYLKDNHFRYVMVNQANQKFFNRTEEEILDKTDFDLMPLESAQNCRESDEEALKNQKILVTEEIIGKKIYETLKFPVNIGNEKMGVGAFIRDITDKKKAEKALKESLEEKEVLLREIHHRVKNNMQIISSLLNLQKKYVEEEETVNILVESQNRIKTMAMIHEKLYQSPNLTSINFNEYTEKLVNDLFYSYGKKMSVIKTSFHMEEVKIGLDTAIPCGLILNELVTNSLKYAFPEDRTGIITIKFRSEGEYFILKVLDDGVGVPEDIKLENKDTLGFQLVTSLVKQLDGTVQMDRSHGTSFTIKFKELHYSDRM
ncbi:PAS domain S-box protein [Methanobacterium sp. YSL]|nr:PAS domain S-box protein [Methanobacterium sp. YSL]